MTIIIVIVSMALGMYGRIIKTIKFRPRDIYARFYAHINNNNSWRHCARRARLVGQYEYRIRV